MKKWNCLFRAVSVAVLLHSAALAQVARSQPPRGVSPKQVVSSPKSEPSSTMEEFLATSPLHFPPAMKEWMKKTDEAGHLAEKGDLEVSIGDWTDAVGDYQQVLTLSPDHSGALYGLGKDSLQRKDIAAAVAYYRRAIYSPPSTDILIPLAFQSPVIRENNVFHIMEYARLLSLTGQQEEALFVYRTGAQRLNYIDGHPHLKLMLPDFGDGPGQIGFTPTRLQALAQVGWAEDHSDFDEAGARARLQQAVSLFPDSPLPYFYRAMYEARSLNDFKGASADFDKAAQVGDPAAVDAVQWEKNFYRDFLPIMPQTKANP